MVQWWNQKVIQKFGDSKISEKKNYTFIQQDCIKSIKSDNEDIYNDTKYFYLKESWIKKKNYPQKH